MKRKNSILTVALIAASVFSIGIIASCTKKTEDTNTCQTTCQNGGTCVDGSCKCPEGYEGTGCEIKSINKFTGVWSVTEEMSLGGTNDTLESGYSVSINAANNSTATELLVDNIANAGNIVRLNATVDGNVMTVTPASFSGKTYAVPNVTRTNDTMLKIHFSVTDDATGTLEKDRTATLTK